MNIRANANANGWGSVARTLGTGNSDRSSLIVNEIIKCAEMILI